MTHFPVTADPYLGEKLFKSIAVTSANGQPRVNLTLSAWGWAIYIGGATAPGGGPLISLAILNNHGWQEATKWSSSVRNALLGKGTMKQQFECHALGALFAGTWNLERWRPTRTVTWVKGVGTHRCNWTTATYL